MIFNFDQTIIRVKQERIDQLALQCRHPAGGVDDRYVFLQNRLCSGGCRRSRLHCIVVNLHSILRKFERSQNFLPGILGGFSRATPTEYHLVPFPLTQSPKGPHLQARPSPDYITQSPTGSNHQPSDHTV